MWVLLSLASQLFTWFFVVSSVTFLPAHPSHLPSSPGDKLVISHQLCPGIRWPAHEDMADIPHLLQCCVAQESELCKRVSCARERVVQKSELCKRVSCAGELHAVGA